MQNARCSMQCHTLAHVFGCIPMTGAYNHFIYPFLYRIKINQNKNNYLHALYIFFSVFVSSSL